MPGYIEDRWMRKTPHPVTGRRETALHGKGKRYKVAGIPGVRDRSFERLTDAKLWLAQAVTKSREEEFVDPRDGTETLAEYVNESWRIGGIRGGDGTRKNIRERVDLHILPHLGAKRLRDIKGPVLRDYIALLSAKVGAHHRVLSPRYIRDILTTLSNILETAAEDRKIPRNPMHARSVVRPKAEKILRQAWAPAVVQAALATIAPRHRIALVLGLGCGLRQGEVFGLTPADIDYDLRRIAVRRQVQKLQGRLYFTLPKGGKTRVVDMPDSVADELKLYMDQFPPKSIELPWGGLDGEGAQRPRRTYELLMTTKAGNANSANTWTTDTWKPMLAKIGVIPPLAEGARRWQWADSPENGFHVTRHTYASVQLQAGESVVTLARWLGHEKPSITFDHYAHFMPEAGEKGRTAVDAMLRAASTVPASGSPQILPSERD